jgi:hypothetical protein
MREVTPSRIKRDYADVVFELFVWLAVSRANRFACRHIVWLCFSTQGVEARALMALPYTRCFRIPQYSPGVYPRSEPAASIVRQQTFTSWHRPSPSRTLGWRRVRSGPYPHPVRQPFRHIRQKSWTRGAGVNMRCFFLLCQWVRSALSSWIATGRAAFDRDQGAHAGSSDIGLGGRLPGFGPASPVSRVELQARAPCGPGLFCAPKEAGCRHRPAFACASRTGCGYPCGPPRRDAR